MAEENSGVYYRKRENQERALAASAIDPAIRAVHAQMADRYAVLAGATDPSRLTIAKEA